jgi:hypothetical protein
MDITKDPIINVINNSIRRSIRITLENECFGAVVMLVYSAIDMLAFLNMNKNQEDVKRQDFVDWVEKYLHFPCHEQLTGLDVYGARCGMLHNFSAYSKLNRDGKCRRLLYADKLKPEINYAPSISKEDVMVSIEGLVEAFFKGLDKFLVDLYKDKSKGEIADRRFEKIVALSPYKLNKLNP